MVTCAEIVRNTLPDNTGEDSVGMLPLFCQAGLSGRKKRGASLNKDIPVEDAVAAVLAYSCPQVVITGGEASMQPEELTHLCQQLRQQGRYITIETNETQFQQVAADLLSISPKLENSNPVASNRHFKQHQRRRINQPVLR